MAARDDDQIAQEFPFFIVYKDGRVKVRFQPPDHKIPPFDDPITGLRSKDAVVSTDPPVSVRVFLPKITDPTRKLPVLLYIHGGGFCMASAFFQGYHKLVATLAAEANAIAVSVEYGLFPDRPIPACYDDSWSALKWIASHAGRNGPEPWLNEHADFDRVFVSGDSAGGNITNTVVNWVGDLGLPGVKVVGAILVHPFFGGTDHDAMWMYMCPENGGLKDRRMKPSAENLGKIGCERVLVFVAEKDHLFEPGRDYVKELKKSEWGGTVELVENWGKEHCFHIMNPKDEKAWEIIQKSAYFINQD